MIRAGIPRLRPGLDRSAAGQVRDGGASDRDYEDIAIGPGPEPGVHYVYVGNIGDNDEKYDSVFIYRFPEPAVSLDQTGKKYIVSGVEQIELVYPFGPRDAEALMVDVNGDIYLVTKYRKPAELYVARYPQTLGQPNLLERLCYVYVEWRDSNSRTATAATSPPTEDSSRCVDETRPFCGYAVQARPSQRP